MKITVEYPDSKWKLVFYDLPKMSALEGSWDGKTVFIANLGESPEPMQSHDRDFSITKIESEEALALVRKFRERTADNQEGEN